MAQADAANERLAAQSRPQYGARRTGSENAQARNYPYVKLNAGYGYQLNRYGNNANRQRQTWGPDVGATLGITLFDGNRRREQRNARIQIENAELTRQQLELSLRPILADFWQAYRNNPNC
ncbi:MAG: TolC family protein [Alistipes sp.]